MSEKDNKSGYLVQSDNDYFLIRDSPIRKGQLVFDQNTGKVTINDPFGANTDYIKVVLEYKNFPSSIKEQITNGSIKIDDWVTIEPEVKINALGKVDIFQNGTKIGSQG